MLSSDNKYIKVLLHRQEDTRISFSVFATSSARAATTVPPSRRRKNGTLRERVRTGTKARNGMGDMETREEDEKEEGDEETKEARKASRAYA